MENKTKIILTLIGLAAVIVPVLMLLFFTSQSSTNPVGGTVPAGNRQIDKGNIEKEVQSTIKTQPGFQSPAPSPIPTPVTPVTESSLEEFLESTPSSQ